MLKQRNLWATVWRNQNALGLQNVTRAALEFLSAAYEESGHRAVGMAPRKHGPNAAKFKTELRAIELAILQTRAEETRMVDIAGWRAIH